MYQENIYEIIENTGESISKLVVPKNSGLKGYAWKVLKQAGLNIDEVQEVSKNELSVGGLTLILKRGEDIPQLIMDYASIGEVVLGVTGDDLYDEFRYRFPQNPLKIENTYDWFDEEARYFRPALCFMNKTGRIEDIPLEARIALNAKYEYTSGDYMGKSPLMQGREFNMTVYSGDAEITVAKNINDCCIETVYSGRTIDDIGLKEIDIIRFSDLVVISALKNREG